MEEGSIGLKNKFEWYIVKWFRAYDLEVVQRIEWQCSYKIPSVNSVFF